MATDVKSLTSGPLLARSATLNFLGMAAPMLIALMVVPSLIKGMGQERFGLLAIVWIGIGYFTLFDFGIGRAVTKMVSERLGRGDHGDLGPLIWSALVLLSVFGALGTILILLLGEPLVTAILKIPQGLRREGLASIRILALGLPIVVVTSGLIGLLQAHQLFGVITAIRLPLGAFMFAGPLISLQFTPSISWATAVLFAGRIMALAVYFWTAARVRPELRQPHGVHRDHIRALLSFGGWLTVTNVVGPIMTYMDRLLVGGIVGLSAVAYYVAPYDVLQRLNMLPHAMLGALFPALAAAYAVDRERLFVLYVRSSRVIYWTTLPVMSASFLLAPEAIMLWLGHDFRANASPVAHWLAAGCIINALAFPAITVLQSSGRADLVAKTHASELIPYLAVLFFLTNTYGITGTAAAWTIRVLADTIILNELVAKALPILRPAARKGHAVTFGTVFMFGSFAMLESLTLRLVAVLMVLVASGVHLLPMSMYLFFRRTPWETIESHTGK